MCGASPWELYIVFLATLAFDFHQSRLYKLDAALCRVCPVSYPSFFLCPAF